MVDLDLRAGTEVLMPGRLLRSRETTPDREEHHEAGTIRRRKHGPDGPRVLRPDIVDLIGLKRSTPRANAGMNPAWVN
jgi:hypothetical protein